MISVNIEKKVFQEAQFNAAPALCFRLSHSGRRVIRQKHFGVDRFPAAKTRARSELRNVGRACWGAPYVKLRAQREMPTNRAYLFIHAAIKLVISISSSEFASSSKSLPIRVPVWRLIALHTGRSCSAARV
jgi:hypothetical protein